MIELGRINRLRALRLTSVGMFLGHESGEEVLLPNKYVPQTLREDEFIDVFVYTDSEDRIIATTLHPTVQRDEFGALRVVSVTSYGAFLDWGLEKDLLVPHREQAQPMEVGQSYVVFVYYDETTDRLVGSSRINRFIEEGRMPDLEEGDEVNLLIYERTDLGHNAVVDNRYRGLLYASETFRALRPGDQLTGYVKRIRDDYRIDLTLQKPGFEGIEPNAQAILTKLQQSGGFLPLTDHSDPQVIYRTLEMSKKTFKKAIGTLYRERKISLEEGGIRLL
ncbi:GntR family transcriptional regulator [Rudanella paleaurantiibacter]|uniref:GntR family transcriptional regulator n=1 Tax=Rudanella paleaurantiibacter TaxID=2614655 RepID=A0A7J5TYS5_9BACT|nr:S1-like domain-containing RNA-binding protein [Rudanella paleaurantiibacter]KAB7730298.1 GntR family transcriptional regulator [Rudanella paleaurantiibacter]